MGCEVFAADADACVAAVVALATRLARRTTCLTKPRGMSFWSGMVSGDVPDVLIEKRCCLSLMDVRSNELMDEAPS